jgi:hypothetical protein
MIAKCNLTAIARKIRAARSEPVAPQLRALHRHMLKLAADSARRGYCTRAGQEIRYAKRLAEESPTSSVYEAQVAEASKPRKRRR